MFEGEAGVFVVDIPEKRWWSKTKIIFQGSLYRYIPDYLEIHQ